MTTDAATLHRLADALDDLGRHIAAVGTELRVAGAPGTSTADPAQQGGSVNPLVKPTSQPPVPPGRPVTPAETQQPAAVLEVQDPSQPGHAHPSSAAAQPRATPQPAAQAQPSPQQPGGEQPQAQTVVHQASPQAAQQPTHQAGADQSPQAALQPTYEAGPHQPSPAAPQPTYQAGADHHQPPQAAPQPTHPQAGPQPYAPYGPAYQPYPGPYAYPMPPAPQPYAQQLYPQTNPFPAYTPSPTLSERLGKEGAGSRLLAWVGGAVTLLGVVLLLVLAVQRGWLGPLPRVLVGAVFGAALVGAGAWLHRKPAARTGAFALAATGIATLYLDAIAATSLYEFLPIPAGLAVGLVTAVGGLLLAVMWDSPLLASSVVVACGVCAPVITQGFTPELVTFLLIIQIATVPVQLRRSWRSLSLTSAIPPLTASLIGTVLHTQNTGVAVAAGFVSAAISLIMLHRTENDPALLAVLAVAPLPVLAAAVVLPKTQAALLAGAVAVVLVATWPLVRGQAGTVAGVAGLVAALQATVTEFDGSAVLLGEAVALAFAARYTKNRFALGGSLAFAVIGGLVAIVVDVTPALLVVPSPHTTADLLAALAAAALMLGAAIALTWAAVRLEILKPSKLLPWLPGGLAALYGAAGLVLCAALLAVAGRSGFLLGHALITVSWTVTALVLLLRGIAVVALRVVGLVLVAAAVAKLVLFDLAALDGLARVGAFLGAGLVLLLAGSRYARMVASR
ncbi:DUF2339 domain-containing protein [Amycolatopsis sp. NPDC005232]|uniref:DUF2339 domain-containing protein n=1 Tax=Amycolatopsis sp. NPDC005232 TaxID=3157027 RepID=UPI0033BE912A